MMDKSIPYYPVIMHRNSGHPIPQLTMPSGFRFCLYKKGDDKEWMDIAMSLGEFEKVEDATEYFVNHFMLCETELTRRCLFLENSSGDKIGTLTNWWEYTGVRRDPWIQWVLIRPEYQGKGLGKAMVFEGIKQMIAIEGDRDIYLHTQTWSYKAINIYRQAGFIISSENGLGGYVNLESSYADDILKQYYR
jgi:GNAT superfamily N-acetyltransferase